MREIRTSGPMSGTWSRFGFLVPINKIVCLMFVGWRQQQ